MNIHSFRAQKLNLQKISVVTCYDFWSAQILNKTAIDCILVGDSLAVVMHGFDTTVHATIEMMALHTAAVARGAKDKFIITDMPFLSCSKGLDATMDAVQQLMQAGANGIKIEGDAHQIDIIKHIVDAGVPVMGHLGLTPQSIHNLGGHRLQAKDNAQAEKLLKSAKALERVGCFSVVLECIPTTLGRCVSQQLNIPTIGIGAGPYTDGQVLVLQDLLGINVKFTPKFLRRYANTHDVIHAAVSHFHNDVVQETYPSLQESYQ